MEGGDAHEQAEVGDGAEQAAPGEDAGPAVEEGEGEPLAGEELHLPAGRHLRHPQEGVLQPQPQRHRQQVLHLVPKVPVFFSE